MSLRASDPAAPDAAPSAKRQVFLVDDHPLVREWLANLINGQPDLAICGEAEEAPKALAAIRDLKPDVAIVDLSLNTGSGLELVKDLKIHAPATAVIVLSMHEESIYGERSLRAGARGYVTKRESTKKILTALRRVLTGGIYVSENFAALIAEKLVLGRASAASGAVRPEDTLSDRELEVFRLLGKGRSTPQIAEMLGLSLKTVQAYCARTKEKLGLPNATELLRAALRFEEGPGASATAGGPSGELHAR